MANDLYKDYVNIASTGLKRNMFSGNQVGTRSIYDKNRAQDAKADMPANNRPFKGLLGKIFGRNKKNSDYRPGTSVDAFGDGESIASEEDLTYTPSGNFTDDYLDTEQTDDSEAVDIQNESAEETIGGELGNVYDAAGTLLPDIDAKKGEKDWIPDYLEGKQGLIPDYFQGKQGLWPDYLPSLGWDAPPEISSKLGKGFYDTKNKLGDWLYNQFSPGDSKSAGDIERMQYPEEIPMEDYMQKYGSSEAGELDENTMYNMDEDAMSNEYLDEGFSSDTDFYGTSSEPGKSYNIGFNPNADLLGVGNQNINRRTKGILGALKLRGM